MNKYNDSQISRLVQERPRIIESNKMKNAIKKCLDIRPELKDLELSQMDQIITAIKLEAKQAIKA
jgi:hypothetical protein